MDRMSFTWNRCYSDWCWCWYLHGLSKWASFHLFCFLCFWFELNGSGFRAEIENSIHYGWFSFFSWHCLSVPRCVIRLQGWWIASNAIGTLYSYQLNSKPNWPTTLFSDHHKPVEASKFDYPLKKYRIHGLGSDLKQSYRCWSLLTVYPWQNSIHLQKYGALHSALMVKELSFDWCRGFGGLDFERFHLR